MTNVGLTTLVQKFFGAIGASRRGAAHERDALPVCPPWRHPIATRRGVVVRVADDGMAPTVPRGAYILVDRSAREWREREIVAVRIETGVIVTRAGHDDAGRRMMVSDNPDWPDTPLPAGAEIVGRALCVARGMY